MSKVTVQISTVDTPPYKSAVHHLPAKIHVDGDAKVNMYFYPVENPDSKQLQATFRGRALAGKTIPLPSNVTGVLLNDTRTNTTVSVIPLRKESGSTNDASDAMVSSSSVQEQSKRPSESRIPMRQNSSSSKYSKHDSGKRSSASIGGTNEDESESEDEVEEKKTFKFVPRQLTSVSHARTSQLNQGQSSSTDETEQVRVWSVDSVFDNVTVWAHDKIPVDGSSFASALEWIPISNAINDPIEE